MRKDLPGWKTNIDEISNGVFKITLTDKDGRKAEIIDNATDETIDKAIGYAFDIEKKTSKNWNKFLYDLCVSSLNEQLIINQKYNDDIFGSWLIEFKSERIIYDGKDSWLILQSNSNNDWLDKKIIKNDDINYETVKEILN